MNNTTHSIRSISSSVILLLAISAHAATVWNGPTISFTKSNYANPLLAENQDRLTANVWITRGSSRGLFNAKTESSFTHYLSPAGTEWANGSLENYATLSYTNWNNWAKGVNPNPYATVGVQAVLHLIADDIYLSVQFTSWTGGNPDPGFSYGGGFSYLRSTPVPEPTNAVPIVTWQQPANNAAFPPGFAISLRARATDSDGTVSNVDFFATPTSGPTMNVGQGTLASSNGYYVRGWTNPPPGQYQLHAEAVDNAGGRGISDSVQIVVVDTSQPPTNAQTRTWTGADPSGNWSAPANWSPAGVLVNGDALVFPGGLPPGDMVSTNDLTDRIFRSITFSGAGGHTIRGNPITLTNRSNCIINSGTNMIACDLTLSGTPSTPERGAASIGASSYPGGELTVIGNVGGGSLYLFGMRLVIRGQFTGGRISVRPFDGTLALYGDNPYAVSASAQPGTLLVQGLQPNLNFAMYLDMESLLCPSLSGDGVVGDVTGCGHIIPDSTLSVKNLSLGDYRGFLDIHLNGTNVGEYSRLIASGDVSLGRGQLLPSAGFNPQAGQVFTIVEKTSPGAITNAPFGPEGTITTLNGMPCRISYIGGDGNDVTLTATPPRLDVARTSPAQVRLSWPTNYPGFQLLRASAIDGSAPWSNHPMSSVVMGSNYTVTQPAATNHEFFRLKQE